MRRPIDKSALALGVPKRIRDEKHRRFIASLPCCECGAQAPTQAAHIRAGLEGGTGLKPCDSLTVPLCWRCHSRQHGMSEEEFHGDIEPVKALAKKLYACTGDGLVGLKLVTDFRIRRKYQ